MVVVTFVAPGGVTMSDVAPSYTVLLVDDNPGERDLLWEAVTAGEHRISLVGFSNGLQALDYLESGKEVDLIMSDLNMPELSGAELVARLQANTQLASIPLVVMSSSSQSLIPLRFHQPEAVPYVRKPSTWAGFMNLAQQMVVALLDKVGTGTAATRLAERARSGQATPPAGA